MRIGILGGTFDPVHSGHIALAREARKILDLDEVWLMPSGEPPYKKPLASRSDRLQMAYLAAETASGVRVCDVEMRRKGETYTVDTLRELKKANPGTGFVYILGSDAAARVHHWKNIDEVRELTEFACVVRKGETADIPEGMLEMETDIPDISSEHIRDIILNGGEAGGMLPKKVADYIAKRGLYLAAMSEAEIIADLKSRLKKPRFEHTLGVAHTAAQLAACAGIPEGKAYIAGLLHDCAKNIAREELVALADAAGADESEKELSPVLHAPVGAYIARERYGVRDEAILSAIRKHTIGAEHMSVLDAVVYVADMVEPGRKPFEWMEDARKLAQEDIFRAAVMCARLTREYNKDRLVHPMTDKMIYNIENGGRNNG